MDSQAGSLVKMRQANCFYLAALIAILCVNFSQQDQLQEDIESEESSEIQNDSPLWPYFYYGSNSDQEAMSKRVLPYIVHKRMPYIVHKRMPYIVHKRIPYIVHKRMPYIVHKRMPAYLPVHKRSTSEEEDIPTKRMIPLEEDIVPEEIAKLLGNYQPRALRMIPFIH